MPLFDFECTECNFTFENFVDIHVDENKVDKTIYPLCPKCEGRTKKLMGAPSFIINGFSEKNGYSRK